MNRVAFGRSYVQSLTQALQKLDMEAVDKAIQALERAWSEQRLILIAGNGGSAATASHMANDLSKTIGAMNGVKGFRAIALTDNVPVMTAWANDVGYEEIFVGPLRTLASRGDLLIVISGSGNSANVLRAVEAAKELDMVTLGLFGQGGGKALDLVDVGVVVPADEYGPIEDVHMVLCHLITGYFQATLNQRP
jgi:D-sedoheptulose 7-phosphate isomerase